MSTLTELVDEIVDDLDRTDLNAQILSEIGRAISFYQSTRFYFNETRDTLFSTVAGQRLYTSDDDRDIPDFYEIDQLTLEYDGQVDPLCEISPKEWEVLTGPSGAEARPRSWAYFNRSIGLFPIPDGIYGIRMIGLIKKAAPTTPDETGNVWMTEAFNLIRSRACSQIGLRKIRDVSIYETQARAESEELSRLLAQTASRVGTGNITPTDF